MLLARREERLEGPTEGFFWLLRARFLDARSPYRWIPRTLGFTASPCPLGLAGSPPSAFLLLNSFFDLSCSIPCAFSLQIFQCWILVFNFIVFS